MRGLFTRQQRLPLLRLARSTRTMRAVRSWASYLLAATAVLLLAACAANAPSPSPSATSATATATAAWQALEQRPLSLPSVAPGATCPKLLGHIVSPDFGLVLGNGPVYPFLGIGGATGSLQAATLVPVQWYIDPSYTGPVLVRGRQLDGSGMLTFEGGLDQLHYHGAWTDAPHLPALRLMGGTAYASGNSRWASFATHTDVPADGCYAYQVDGTSFSYALTFLAEEIEY
jgi:hypothetical protein